MLKLCRGYLSININHSRRLGMFTGRFVKKWWQCERTNKSYPIRCFSNFTLPVIENRTDVKGYVPFEEVLKVRRLQAKRSILVQVHSEQSCSQLHEYCLRFGPINKMIHYSLQSNMHFVLVEFEEERSTTDVLLKSSHTDNTQIIPVRSQFMWFRANDNGKKKKKLSEVENNSQSYVEFGTLSPPSDEEITSWLSTHKDISEQMQLLYHATRLDELGTRLRFLTALQIENTLSGMFPLIRALPYGSSVNSFGKINCDLDVVINLDLQKFNTSDSRLIFQTKTSLVNNRTQQQRYIETMGDLIERYLPGCCGVKRILLARVPILKFRQEYTGVECDLSLMNMTGVYMSELLHIYSSIDERVCPLVYTIRYWAQVVNLTNPTPGRWITNFSLTLLVLFYLQQIKVIPTLEELIKLSKPEDKRFADDVNCTFLRDITPLLTDVNNISNTSSLAELLKGFFEFYALFDFDSHAISLKSGKTLPKQEYSSLYIVNPLESHLNVSKNVSPEELGRIRIEICNAARYLDRELRMDSHNAEEWGLVTLFQSSHYNSRGKALIYDKIQRKRQPAINTNNRLVSVTDLFDESENDALKQEGKETIYHQSNMSDQKSRKR